MKKVLSLSIATSVLGLLMIGSISQAEVLKTYTCTLRVFDASSVVVIEEVFQAGERAGEHGGEAAVFTSKDKTSKVALAIDGKWMLLNWTKNDKVIANVISVVGLSSTTPRALIAYNPENSEEQAAVDCQPNVLP